MALITSSVALLLLLMAKLATAQPNFVDCKNPRAMTAVLTRENEFVVFYGPHVNFVKKDFHHSLPVVREDAQRNYLGTGDKEAAWMIGNRTFATIQAQVCGFSSNRTLESCRSATDSNFWFPDLKATLTVLLDGFYSGANLGSETIIIFRRIFVFFPDRDKIIAVIDNNGLTTKREVKYPAETNDDNVPSALGFVASENGTYSIHVFFEHVYGLYKVPKDLSRPILADQSVLFRTARTWYGCSPELCLEADFDAAVFVNGKHQMIRGKYFWEFGKFDKTVAPTEAKKVTDIYKVNQDIEAGFAFDRYVYLIAVGKEVHIYDLNKNESTKKPCSEVFAGFTGQVDAAFVWDTNIFLIEGNTVTTFTRNSSDRFGLGRATVAMTSHWTQLPSNVDSATLVRDANNVKKVMFTKGNFYYLGNEPKVGTRSMVSNEMSQGFLFNCPDETYRKLKGNLISINSYDQFVTYIRKFKPKEVDPGPELPTTPSTQPTGTGDTSASPGPTEPASSPDVSTTTPTPTTTSRGGQGQGQTKSIVLPIVIGVIGFLVLAAAAIAFFVGRKKARAEEKRDRYLKTVRKDGKDSKLGDELVGFYSANTIESIDSDPLKKVKENVNRGKGSLPSKSRGRVMVIEDSS